MTDHPEEDHMTDAAIDVDATERDVDPTEPDDEATPGTAIELAPSARHDIVGAPVPVDAELRGIAELAVTLAGAELVPAALRNKPNDVMLVLLTARDLGVGITTALREFHPIEGKVTVSPKVRLAIIRQRGLGRVWPDPANNDQAATWYATRADEDHAITYSSTFTLDDARRVEMTRWEGPRNQRQAVKSNLAEKDNWKHYPQRMLSWRALGYLLDDAFGEVGTGLYSADEMGAVTDEEGHVVVDVEAVEIRPGMADPRRGGRRATEAGDDAGPTLASEQARAELRARIDSLPDGGREALKAAWTEKSADTGAPRLRPLAQLLEGEVVKADALLRSIEKRAERGEWGDWTPPVVRALLTLAGIPTGEAPASSDDEATQAALDEVDRITDVAEALEPHQQTWLNAAMEAAGVRWDRLMDEPAQRATLAELVAGAAKQKAPADEAPAEGAHDDAQATQSTLDGVQGDEGEAGPQKRPSGRRPPRRR